MALMFLSRSRNKRSNLPYSQVHAMDMGVGTVRPAAVVPVVTGDRFYFDPSAFVQAMPMKAPLVNGYRLCLEYFFAPSRLYHKKLLLNERNVTSEPDKVVFPSVLPKPVPDSLGLVDFGPDYFSFKISGGDPEIKTDNLVLFSHWVNVMVQPGSILDALGFPVGWTFTDLSSYSSLPSYCKVDDDSKDRFYINVTPVCAYLDIVLNYYANEHVDFLVSSMYVNARDLSNSSGEEIPGKQGQQYESVRLDLAVLQNFISGLKIADDPSKYIYDSILDELYMDSSGRSIMSWEWLCAPCSLFQRSFPDYYLESWIKTSYGTAIDSTIKVDVEDNSVKFTNIRAASHLQRYLELAMSGGSRYSDYLNAQFDASKLRNTAVPLYLGSDRKSLGSNVIYQTTGFLDSDSPLGAFAGQSSGGDKFRKRSFKFGEEGYFMVMVSLMPDTIYYRGLPAMFRQLRLDDFYAPALDNIGFEPLPVERMDALPPLISDDVVDGPIGKRVFEIRLGSDRPGSLYDQQRAVGFVPAWSSLMQGVSRAHGQMQGALKYWMLARDYSSDGFNDNTQESIDQFLEAFEQWVSEKKGGSLGFAPTVRTFFDNIRRRALYHPYVLNHLYNGVFADVSPDATNFVLTISLGLTINREKSKINIPNTL